MGFNSLIRGGARFSWAKIARDFRRPMLYQVRYAEKEPPGLESKPPGKVENVDKINMPGFVNPENINEEGYFTQKAKHQLEELKKKLEKPTVENTEKKD